MAAISHTACRSRHTVAWTEWIHSKYPDTHQISSAQCCIVSEDAEAACIATPVATAQHLTVCFTGGQAAEVCWDHVV
jgi:hypothetical protein